MSINYFTYSDINECHKYEYYDPYCVNMPGSFFSKCENEGAFINGEYTCFSNPKTNFKKFKIKNFLINYL